jgi:hypothetical protein
MDFTAEGQRRWLQEHRAHPLRDPKREDVRNRHWFHMQNGNILSMPDCWEYPPEL